MAFSTTLPIVWFYRRKCVGAIRSKKGREKQSHRECIDPKRKRKKKHTSFTPVFILISNKSDKLALAPGQMAEAK
jgi:hypothetical protein